MNEPEYTRWRLLDQPVSPLDPIQPDGPRYEEGKLPVGFLLLVYDERTNRLSGPVRFLTPEDAAAWLEQNVTGKDKVQYLVIPRPLT